MEKELLIGSWFLGGNDGGKMYNGNQKLIVFPQEFLRNNASPQRRK